MSNTTWIRQAGNVAPDEEHENFTLRGRAQRADHAIAAYNDLRGDPEFAETDVSDLLTDLMHLVDREGWDWKEVLTRASQNYDAEIHKEE